MTEHSEKKASDESAIIRFQSKNAAFTDAKLVELVQAGDSRYFEELMHRYLPVVTAFLWGKMWERDEIEDLAQEIFIRSYTKIGQLRDGSRYGHWLLRIARHAWADHCRNPGTQRRKLHVEIDDAETGIDLSLKDSSANPAESAVGSELEEMVRIAIGELKERYRLVLYLRIIDGKSNSDIAELMGLKENAVRTRFSRGLDTLRKSLIKKGLKPF